MQATTFLHRSRSGKVDVNGLDAGVVGESVLEEEGDEEGKEGQDAFERERSSEGREGKDSPRQALVRYPKT